MARSACGFSVTLLGALLLSTAGLLRGTGKSKLWPGRCLEVAPVLGLREPDPVARLESFGAVWSPGQLAVSAGRGTWASPVPG